MKKWLTLLASGMLVAALATGCASGDGDNTGIQEDNGIEAPGAGEDSTDIDASTEVEGIETDVDADAEAGDDAAEDADAEASDEAAEDADAEAGDADAEDADAEAGDDAAEDADAEPSEGELELEVLEESE